ncbi:MAG: flagellar biosynthesis protein FlhA [Myxococcales bacterium]|nr:flagellar biosynthesis protein FlhA [Myxococcales bacterium]
MMNRLRGQSSLIFTCAVVGLLLLMVLPIPTFLLDTLLALNIALAMTVLVVSLYMKQPLEFSAFPAMLLVSTLFRLTLNIASTRLILLRGAEGPDAAGAIIATFGDFVVGGNYVVGIIVFVILVIINFVVITKGSGRIAEVGARFTLDAMPGKQMAIDADLNAGLIDEATARRRREKIEQEADFYGAMDGASKFVRGDAIAGILITAINIVGGFIIGMTQHGLPAAESAATFTILTVGDGLVSQIPALVISTAAGIIVSRAASSADLGSQLVEQLFSARRVLYIVAAILIGFGLLPGMPLLVFWSIAAVMFFAGRAAEKDPAEGTPDAPRKATEATEPGERPLVNLSGGKPDEPIGDRTDSEKIESLLPIDLLELEVGYGLIGLVDRTQNGELLDRIQSIRRQFASQMGIIVPPIHIRDNLQLPPGGYSLLIKGVEIADGQLMPDRFLAMNPGEVVDTVPGVETTEPAFGLPAVWIDAAHKDQAEQLGYTVVDCATVVATHLSEVLKENAHELLGRQELQELIDVFAKQAPKMVEDLIPEKIQIGDILKVMKNLLREQISVRDLRTILEAIADHVHLTRNPEILTEFARQRLGRYITSRMKAEDGRVHVLTVDGSLEEAFRGQIQQVDGDFHLGVSPQLAEQFLGQLEKRMGEMSMHGWLPVLLVAPELRRPVRNLVERFMPQLMVVSHKEIAAGVQVDAAGVVGAGLAGGGAASRAPRRAPAGARALGAGVGSRVRVRSRPGGKTESCGPHPHREAMPEQDEVVTVAAEWHPTVPRPAARSE